MNDPTNEPKTLLWWIRPMEGLRIDEGKGQVFAGSEDEMEKQIGELHRKTGRQHAATRVE